MQCVLDNDFKTLSPVGKKTTSLVLDASYILAKKSFINLVKEKFSRIKINNLEFVSSALGQAMQCEPIKNDKRPIAIVDVGHISTSVCVYKGEGLALLTSFAMGGGHISSDLMQVLGLNFKSAELIKRKVILTIESKKNEYYDYKNCKDEIEKINLAYKMTFSSFYEYLKKRYVFNEIVKNNNMPFELVSAYYSCRNETERKFCFVIKLEEWLDKNTKSAED